MGRNGKKDKMMPEPEYFESDKFKDIVSELSNKSGMPSQFSIRAIEGGRNNKVFCVAYQDGTKALLKSYFWHPIDKRDRLKAEYLFMNFAWNKVKCLPKPIAADFQNKIGLYEFIDGRKLSQSDINENKIKEALDFFIEINKYKHTEEAKNLPIASEACFSVKEHIDIVNRRIEKFKKINDDSEANQKAILYIKNELSKEWEKTLEHINKCIAEFKLNPDKKIPNDETCISPSDFGYHNAILNKSGKLIFIDFEYAGWDDPAKMACDFFCQPEVQIPIKYLDLFIKSVANAVPNPEKFKSRVIALLPLYKIKWCCILLNEFLEIASERRNFAYGVNDLQQEKINQLEKSRKYLEDFNFKI